MTTQSYKIIAQTTQGGEKRFEDCLRKLKVSYADLKIR